MKQNLMEERSRLVERLNWLGLKSAGSERIEQRIKEIDHILQKK